MSSLTTSQEQAKAEIIDFLLNPDKKYFVLKGVAGTGKSFLINRVEKDFVEVTKLLQSTGEYTPLEWKYTATTHKAAQALRNASSNDTCTIHSLLSLQLKSNYNTGKNFLVRASVEDVENLVIVIDEASYIDYDLLEAIDTYTVNCKVIFMGDPAQLTPIGLNHSPVFLAGFPTHTLTQVVRQSAVHPLSPILHHLREYVLGNSESLPKIATCPELVRLSDTEFNKVIIDEFSTSWCPAKSKVLAWRNKTVMKYNQLLFSGVNNRSNFEVGDVVVNNKAIPNISTDVEVEIVSVLSMFSLGVRGHRYIVNTGLKSVSVFVPDNPADYKKHLNRAIKDGKTEDVKTIMDTWADLRPVYASTVNKAQGSTYDKVFIDLGDFKTLKDPNQLARLLYVSLSRAKYQVVFTGDL
jgi:hypothetical protein